MIETTATYKKLKDLINLRPLSQDSATQLATFFLQPEKPTREKFDLLNTFSQQDPNDLELLAFVQTLKKNMIPLSLKAPLMDLCGTGGSQHARFNTSTATAFVLASLGVPIVKHGNRGSKKANGSFDFLEALGINFELSTAQQRKQFEKFKLCFCFAQHHHPSMKHVAEIRKRLGKRSIFNYIGPFCNPAPVTHHLLGTACLKLAKTLCHVAKRLNYTRMIIVAGYNQLDEACISGPNKCFLIEKQHIHPFSLNAKDYGLSGTLPEINDSTQSASYFLSLLNTFQKNDPILNLICLNAGLALYTYGKTFSISSGITAAKIAFESGLVKHFFDSFKSYEP